MSTKTLLITDLDNTLWDWFKAWYESFSALLSRLEALSGVPAAELEPQIRKVHQRRGTSEYSWLINEVPALVEAAHGVDLQAFYDDALHAQSSARVAYTTLYPGVADTFAELRGRGVMIAAYTESVAYWTEWRIKKTGLDGVIDRLYSAPDHDHPVGVAPERMRTLPEDQYGLKATVHEHVPAGTLKPNVKVLLSILSDCGRRASEAAYVGDSPMKDVAMAQEAGVLDLHAKYGEPQWRPEYALLQRVSHWPDSQVKREQDLGKTNEIVPSVVLNEFADVLTVFDGGA